MIYSIEPVAFISFGTSSSIVLNPGFVWCADADMVKITSLPCDEH
jgi:hypothetical protein